MYCLREWHRREKLGVSCTDIERNRQCLGWWVGEGSNQITVFSSFQLYQVLGEEVDCRYCVDCR